MSAETPVRKFKVGFDDHGISNDTIYDQQWSRYSPINFKQIDFTPAQSPFFPQFQNKMNANLNTQTPKLKNFFDCSQINYSNSPIFKEKLVTSFDMDQMQVGDQMEPQAKANQDTAIKSKQFEQLYNQPSQGQNSISTIKKQHKLNFSKNNDELIEGGKNAVFVSQSYNKQILSSPNPEDLKSQQKLSAKLFQSSPYVDELSTQCDNQSQQNNCTNQKSTFKNNQEFFFKTQFQFSPKNENFSQLSKQESIFNDQYKDHPMQEIQIKKIEDNNNNNNNNQQSPLVLSKQFTCNCKKSKCLKLYCECFANGEICGNNCRCNSCSNTQESNCRTKAIDSILNRDPHAFNSKIQISSNTSKNVNIQETKVHRRGCNCKKSNCLKKYCECYQAGIVCSEHCKCEQCKNGCNHSMPEDKNKQLEAKQFFFLNQSDNEVNNNELQEEELFSENNYNNNMNKKVKKIC